MLRGGRAGDELKQAATTMLRTGEPSKRAKAAGGIGGSVSSSTKSATAMNGAAAAVRTRDPPAADEWVCKSCTLLNTGDTLFCKACSCAREVAPVDSSWTCPSCTLQNPAHAARCTACGETKPKGAKASRPRPMPVDLDDDDAAAFAPPKSKSARHPTAAPPAPPSTVAPNAAAPIADDEDSMEWE